ncbi:vacuolar protein sorting-associated protein 36 [Tanacetum coccineum]
MQEVILFYNGLGIPTRQILDSRSAIPSMTAADAKVAIQEMAEYSQKWHNGTSRSRSTETSNGLTSIQAQLNNLGREIKKVNEKVYEKETVKAVDRTMQNIIGVKLPFSGKIIILGGDFRQVLPVLRRGTRAQVVDSSLRIDGVEEVISEDYDTLINKIFLSFATDAYSFADIVSKAILSTKNEHVDIIIDMLIDRFLGQEKGVINVEIAVGQHTEVRVLLPRIAISPSKEDMLCCLPRSFMRRFGSLMSHPLEEGSSAVDPIQLWSWWWRDDVGYDDDDDGGGAVLGQQLQRGVDGA